MEGAVCDTHQRSHLRVVSVFAIALEEGQRGDEVAFLHKVGGVWQSELLLLTSHRLLVLRDRYRYLQHELAPWAHWLYCA